jgi:hydroxymethylglutaryl-CoA lyase
VSTDAKVELIERLTAAGLSSIEVTSFVSPKRIPQLADAGALLARLRRASGVRYAALTPNRQGANAALAAGVKTWAIFASASETFSLRNIGCSIAESLERFAPVMDLAKARGIDVRGYVSCVAGCPYEGPVEPEAVARVAGALMQLGVYEVSLGDTIGVGTPSSIGSMLEAVTADIAVERLAIHCHDTYGRALVNIQTALDRGIAVVDSAVGGLGGCPYAPGASGNVATEDLLHMLEELGIGTGVNLPAVIEAAWFISGELGREPASKVALARRPASIA